MHRTIIFFLSLILTIKGYPQVSSLTGNVCDENGTAIGYAPVVLLSPADSTLAFFGVTNEKGLFEIKGIRNGKYLLQVAFIGHQTVYQSVTIPFPGGENIGAVVMKSKPISLGEVVVEEEHIPMQFRRDTIEFNTAAFTTKPDAVVEDLLKKLPGIDVDRAGNIKAMGEDVKKVLVDGKEFFGSDPKLATRNVPADALRKIQVYDKRSDESEFTGIDDGTRDKTLNLLLKDSKKNAVFGELMAGGSYDGHYQGSGKVYKFSKKNQFAALGMLNNINQFGFSFRDYIDFSGGLTSLGDHGGSVQIKLPAGGGSSFPVNFGKPVNGISTSGAVGFNFSHESKENSRVFLSYIANGSDRKLLQSTSTRNFTEDNSFQQEEELDENKTDFAQRLNFGVRERIDSTQNIIINGNASISYGKTGSKTNSSVFSNVSEKNRLSSQRNDKARRLSANISGSYMKLINRGKTVFRLSSDALYSRDFGNSKWNNDILSFDPVSQITTRQFQDNKTKYSDISVNASLIRKSGKFLYLQPELKAGRQTESLSRIQGIPSVPVEKIDSLSPGFKRDYLWFRPGFKVIRNTEKTQFTLGILTEIGKTSNSLNMDKAVESDIFFFVPNLSWEYEYQTGRRLRVYYETTVNLPTVNQLLPIVNISNPLILSSGNRYLKPEIDNSLSMNWWIFDQFSFTTFLAGINTGYTRDKINWNRRVDENLKQVISLINVSEDYRIQANSDFSTPVRKLGIKINANVEETWNRSLSYVNNIENVNTNLSHRISLSVENRKKTKWDVIVGSAFQMTDARFSIQNSLNNIYFDLSCFSEMRFTPDKHWNFQFTTDVTNFNSRSFGSSLTVPLLGAEISYYFLKNNRGTFTLQGTDLLNRNTGIERTSDLNFLKEQRSNMLGRFFMLTFKFRLNRFGDAPGSIDVKVNSRP